MQINTTIMLDAGETLAGPPDWAAQNILAAVGGNPANDYCTVYVQTVPSAESGEAGTPPPPPEGP